MERVKDTDMGDFLNSGKHGDAMQISWNGHLPKVPSRHGRSFTSSDGSAKIFDSDGCIRSTKYIDIDKWFRYISFDPCK